MENLRMLILTVLKILLIIVVKILEVVELFTMCIYSINQLKYFCYQKNYRVENLR
jgi:hypothetical protein